VNEIPGSTVVRVEDVRLALSKWSSVFYDFPSREMNIVGITGTNGKTTIAGLIHRMLLEEGKAGLIGTSGYFYDSNKGSFGMTTPHSNDIHYIFRKMLDEGVKNVVMEVSSHALVLKRVEEIQFQNAIFTNLTQDHLDFHGSMDEYFSSKFRLFDMVKNKKRGTAIINSDDAYGRKIIEMLEYPAVTYAIESCADYRATVRQISLKGSVFTLEAKGKKVDMCVHLIGKYNIYNCLAAIAWALEGGRDMETVCNVVSKSKSVPGRLEILVEKGSGGRAVIIDYAHTPAALENVLMTLRALTKSKLVCVFGCGGDRDRDKRPLMGKVAGIIADKVYLTSDNPRSEDPTGILLDIEVGIRDTATEYYVMPDRKEAIRKAIQDSGETDCILIAGKGDEDYQIIGDKRIPFSDRLEAHKYL
jgi:UDP-N-acetylmuramoyl-L-alanyl-D-glutamate--2,6-diaminopimelate ligase